MIPDNDNQFPQDGDRPRPGPQEDITEEDAVDGTDAEEHDNEPGGPGEYDIEGEGARVVDLTRRLHPAGSAVPDDDNGPVAGEVLEGVVVNSSDSPAGTAVAHVRSAGRVLVTVVRHDRTAGAGRAVARNLAYVPAGAWVLLRRGWESRTTARYQRLMRAAEAAGNVEALAEWEQRVERFKAARHARLMSWATAPVAFVRSAAITALGTLIALVVLGVMLAFARHDLAMVPAPILAVITAVNVTVTVVGIVLTWAAIVGPWLVLGLLWDQGRRRASMPAWLVTTAPAEVDVVIDERMIALALGALRIPQITAALKEGPLQFITPARTDGRGTHAVIRLPAGVTAEKIAKRRADLATGLFRLAKEVWPTTGAEAGVLDLWVADKGALAEGAGPYPLLSEGSVDVFKGVPFGKTLRGDPIVAPVMERNTLTGGMPGQGKSSAARVMMAGAALDPTVELRIWVPDTNFDFEAFAPRASRYVMGASEEHFKAIVQDLRDLHEEVQTRGELLVRYETPAVTRELASKGVGLHPMVCLLEEAHVLIQHKTHGAEAARLLCDIVRLARKRGIHFILSTQAPTKDSMPRDVTRNCSNGIAFAVGDHVANDALLGQGAYRAGHRATELIPGTDRGTAVVKGFTGERSQIVQVYFLDTEKPGDQITPIIDRALKAIARRNKPIPGTGRLRAVAESRDLLTDLAEVLGEHPVPAADVPALLARAFPHWAPYKALTGKTLRARLDRDHGVKVPSTGNRWPLDPDTVRDALARRDRDDDRDDEGRVHPAS